MVITAERVRLAEERAAINALTGRAEAVSVQASELGDQISSLRRDLFTNTLIKRTELGPGLMSEAMVALNDEIGRVERIYGSWIKFVWSFKWQAVLAWCFFSLLAALVLMVGAFRLFGWLIHRETDEDPTYTSRLSVAFWSTLIPTVAMAALAGIVYLLADSLSLLRRDVAPVIVNILADRGRHLFRQQACTGQLSPKMPAWRLVNITNNGARFLYAMVVALVVVNGLDYVLTTVSQTLDSPVVLTVAKGLLPLS
jgi:potassium efflux system protein